MDLFFGALRGGGEQDKQQTAEETIAKLSDRALNSSLLEDRRSAILGLRGLCRDWKLQVGTKAMPSLIHCLKNDRMDTDITKASLETLNHLCTKDNDEQDLGSMLTEIFIKDHQNVALLLDILAEVDFYVRYNCVQFLTTLLNNSRLQFQEAVMTSPMGVSRLIDLLDDHREIIRNEGLLLLISVTEQNADIQKVVAFENAFERLFTIILEEGATDGGIIVQDCLQLMQNLLRYNVSNQNLFRETSCINHIPNLFVSKQAEDNIEKPLTDPSVHWTNQKAANTQHVLHLIRILVGPNTANTFVNQNVLGNLKIVQDLFSASMSGHIPDQVRVLCLYTVSDLVRNHEQNQNRLGNAIIMRTQQVSGLPQQKLPPGQPTPSLVALISTALEKEKFYLRYACLQVFESYLTGNADAQLAILSTMVEPPQDNPNTPSSSPPVSAGSLLLKGLLDTESKRDPYQKWFASQFLLFLMADNAKAKQQTLKIKIDGVSLVHQLCFQLITSKDDIRVQIGLLSLLSVWLFDCVQCCAEFLSEGSNVQFLVEQMSHASVDTMVQGLCAFMFSCLVQFNNDSEPSFTRSNLQSLALSRIGPDVFSSKIARLKESTHFTSKFTDLLEEPKEKLASIFFEQQFVDFFKMEADHLIKSLVNTRQKSPGPKIDLSSKVKEQEDRIKQLESQLEKPKTDELSLLKSTVQSLQSKIEQMQLQYNQLNEEHEDLLLLLADQDQEMQVYKDQLKAYGHTFEDE
ncbi:p115 like vesicle tethering protein [Gorgonomyces haynaldii]|nr:p115 like vesicle tethering protein [Gorgonomyces haynaldii]